MIKADPAGLCGVPGQFATHETVSSLVSAGLSHGDGARVECRAANESCLDTRPDSARARARMRCREATIELTPEERDEQRPMVHLARSSTRRLVQGPG